MAKTKTFGEEFEPVNLGTGETPPTLTEHKPAEAPTPATAIPGAPVGYDPLLAQMFLDNQKASLLLMQEHLKQRAADAESRLELERKAALYQKTCAERTQDEANRRYAADIEVGCPRYRVSIPGDRNSTIPVVIPARTPEEAWGKYMGLCGVRATEHEWHAQLVEG